jgi:hypothetical protein
MAHGVSKEELTFKNQFFLLFFCQFWCLRAIFAMFGAQRKDQAKSDIGHQISLNSRRMAIDKKN